MKISHKWLSKYITLSNTPEEIASKLTYGGLEVESVELVQPIKGGLEGLVVGEVLTCERIPETEKLHKTTVQVGAEVLSIVCGAPNVRAGLKVIVATQGATLYPAEGEPIKIKKGKIRGEVSEGMLCGEDEIGVGKSHAGIIEVDAAWATGTPAAKVYHLESDYVYEIGLTPNRADAASHLGVARDLSVLYRTPLNVQTYPVIKAQGDAPNVKVENTTACPRYTGLVIKNVKVAPSPEWLQNQLKTIGLSPINNIVDITNYVLHSIGQPMHAFDYDQIAGKQVFIRHAKANEVLLTLDGVERKLHEQDLVIADAEKAMCIAGVMGGKNSGVSSSTTSIFLESAYFNVTAVRKASQRHGIKTDSSFRFERGTDPNMPLKAQEMAVALILELAGGEVASSVFDSNTQEFAPFEVASSYAYISKYIGKHIPKAEIKAILTGLEMVVDDKNDDEFIAKVPAYRVDVTRPADLVEDVLRIYGYDNIPLSETLSTNFIAKHPSKNADRLQKIIASVLVANGYSEMMTNSLTTPQYAELVEQTASSVEIQNKLSEELGVMRQDLLFSGLEVLRYNINRRQTDLKLYELGFVYGKNAEGKFWENQRLSLFVTGNAQSATWKNNLGAADFFLLKQAVIMILEKLGIHKYTLTPIHNTVRFAYGLELKLKDKVLGVFGQVSNTVLSKLDIKTHVFAAEFDAEALLKAYQSPVLYSEVTKFPEVKRDLSLVIDKKVTFEELVKLAKQTEKKILSDINVFDVFEGKQLGEQKKAYALSFTLIDKTQTLTDQVIDKTMERLMKAYETEFSAVIRK
jgi:phenylalanyl-tRNA synthetase beta chain